ncbi:MAG: hypothetical protein OHK0017_01630 [Patescibacteria group bacterium]
MKTILVDAVNTFVSPQGQIFQEMYNLLETFQEDKIILTNADDSQIITFGLDKMPYPIFTLKHNPDKPDPQYFQTFLEKYKLKADEVIYFEHNPDAVNSAQSVGINTFHFNKDTRDLIALEKFLKANL